jgi:hypothetical protein
MMMLTVLGGFTLVLLGVATARWFAARAIEEDLSPEETVVLEDRSQLLPEGHQPPPGLSPLSPSERFLAAEATRGLRDLEKYLIDAA